jgi:deoxycytidylate deaminase
MEDYEYMIRASKAKVNSTCIKKQLGCLLVLSNGETIEGWNGPPEMIKTCHPECPRKISGKDLHLCRAVHAERRCLLISARLGFSTEGSTLYSYMGIPCKDCLLELIEAKVHRIVVENPLIYDDLSEPILKEWIERGGKFDVISMGEKPTHSGRFMDVRI